MKIAMVAAAASSPGYLGRPEGSAQNVLVDGLARALATRGHAVEVYVARTAAERPARVGLARNLTLVSIPAEPFEAGAGTSPAAGCPAFGDRLAELWLADPPDIVHAFSRLSGKAALLAARGAGAALIQTFVSLAPAVRRHGDVDAAAGRLEFGEQSALIAAAARVIVTSSADVFALLGMGAKPSSIRLVPCGVDLELFTPALRREPHTTGLRLAILGRRGASESILDTIEALASVDAVELVIGGDFHAADAAELRAFAQTRGVGDRVTFAGRIERSEVAAFLRMADAAVCAPRQHSMGTVALEAMACGIPVIASSVGGLVDLVADGMTGLHVPPGAPRQLAYAIEALKADAPLRERMGRFGVERARARYGWSRIGAETFDIYAGVLRHASIADAGFAARR